MSDLLKDHLPAVLASMVGLAAIATMGALGWMTLRWHTDPSDHEIILVIVNSLGSFVGGGATGYAAAKVVGPKSEQTGASST